MKLGKGINYTRYCLWWEGSEEINYNDYMQLGVLNRDKISQVKLKETAEHVKLIKRLGFETVRLPIAFNVWSLPDATDISQSSYWVVVDNMLKLCNENGLKLVIDYHHAPLSDQTFDENKARIKALWIQIAERLKNTDSSKVIFEVYNEPDNISTDNLVIFYQEVIDSIRKTGSNNTQRKIVVGGNGFYEIGFGDVGLIPFLQRQAFKNDPNIIYTVHFYEPRFFTMQGLGDGDVFLPVENVEFPATKDFSNSNIFESNEFFANNYFEAKDPDILALNLDGKGMGSIEFVKARMMQLKVLTDAGLQVWCSEIGVYSFFAQQVQNNPNTLLRGSLERYLKALLDNLKAANIDWCWWDFEGSMSFFNPVPRLQKGSIDMAKPYSFAEPYLDEKIDPFMRKILGLNERVSLRIITKRRNKATKLNSFRLTINCLDEVSNIKDFVLSYKRTSFLGGTPALKFSNKTILPQKSITFTITGHDLSIINLRVNHTDGSFMIITKE